jgi:quercetin dioxygenase-like cupin family protein
MDIFKIQDMKGGWFIGDFEPSIYKTKEFEVGVKTHPKGEVWDTHYHKLATEINYLIDGKMIIQDTELNSGDIFVLHPNEVANPIFLEDCSIVTVKTISSIGDKYVI